MKWVINGLDTIMVSNIAAKVLNSFPPNAAYWSLNCIIITLDNNHLSSI